MTSETDLEKLRRQDARDFNDELAGRETGRLKRFFPNDEKDVAEARERREARQLQTALQQMLMDREYARLYADAQDALSSAQAALERAILQNAQAIENLEHTIEEMEAAAATLENGEKVFLSEDGSLYTAAGRRLNSHEAARVAIPPNAPSYEEYTETGDSLARERERRTDLTGEKTDELRHAQTRLEDQDHPMTGDELRTFHDEMGLFERSLDTRAVASVHEQPDTAPSEEAGQPVAQLDTFPRPG